MLGRNHSVAAALLAAFCWLLGAPPARADAPALLPVQGRLLDASGTPIDGTKDVTFHLYDAETGGTALFSETQSVTFDQGEFTVYLGSVETLDLGLLRDANAYWLELVVDGETLSPRLRLGSVPYAGFAQYCGEASSLQGSGPEAFARADHTHAFGDLQDIPSGLSDGDDDTLGGLSCDAGQVARWDGSNWVCDADRDTTYTAGAGLNLSGHTFSVDTSAVQARVSRSCPAGSAIRAVAADGSVSCEPDDDTTYTAGPGLRLAGTTFSADTNYLQRRVSHVCTPGWAIRAISPTGAVVCEHDDDTTYRAGSGLQLSGTTFSVQTNGILSSHIAPNAVGPSELGVPHGSTSGTATIRVRSTYYDVAITSLTLHEPATCTFWVTGTVNGLDGNEPNALGYFTLAGTGMPAASAINRALVGRPVGSTSPLGTTGSLAFTASLTAGVYTYRCRFVPLSASTWSYLQNDQVSCSVSYLCT